MEDKDLLQLFKNLSPEERKSFLSKISNGLLGSDPTLNYSSVQELLMEKKFTNGMFCPKCNSDKVVKHGKQGKTPRFICKNCKKSFSITTDSIFSSHKVDVKQYIKYITLMVDGASIRECAKQCQITVKTSFLWRHKFLDTLKDLADSEKVGGIVEADETYMPLSFKGSILLPRNPHKRGHQIHKRGLSQEQVCVPTALDRNDHSISLGAIAKATNLGIIGKKPLMELFEGRIEPGSVLCADTCHSYVPLANKLDLNLIQFRTDRKDRSKSVLKTNFGKLHINHINSYHNSIKEFLAPFHGVATKYVNNYLNWNNYLNQLKTEDKIDLLLTLFVRNPAPTISNKVQDRAPIPFPTKYDKFYSVAGVFLQKSADQKSKPLPDEIIIGKNKYHVHLGKPKNLDGFHKKHNKKKDQ